MWLHTGCLELLWGFWRLSFPTWLWIFSISTVWSWFEPWQKSCEVVLPNYIPDLFVWRSLYPKSSPAKCGSTLHLTCDATCNYLITHIHEGSPELTKSINHRRIYLQSGKEIISPTLPHRHQMSNNVPENSTKTFSKDSSTFDSPESCAHHLNHDLCGKSNAGAARETEAAKQDRSRLDFARRDLKLEVGRYYAAFLRLLNRIYPA